MNEPTMQTLVERLDHVECEARRLKLLGGITVTCLSLILLLGATARKVEFFDRVTATSFVLLDKEMMPTAELGLSTADTPALWLFDKNGTRRAALGLSSEGTPNLILSDKTGTNRATLGVGSDSMPALFFWPKGPHERTTEATVELSVNSDGSPRLVLGQHNTRAVLHSVEGATGLVFVLKNKKPRARLGISADGSPALILLDENGKVRAELGSTSLETTRTGMVEQRPESSLVLFDKAGKAIWSAP